VPELRSRFVFTVEQRDAVREHLLRRASEDDRVVAAADVRSLAVSDGDRFSYLDLAFAVADDVAVADVLESWSRTLVDELDTVHLADWRAIRPPTACSCCRMPQDHDSGSCST
jgi:hypothetical protein